MDYNHVTWKVLLQCGVQQYSCTKIFGTVRPSSFQISWYLTLLWPEEMLTNAGNRSVSPPARHSVKMKATTARLQLLYFLTLISQSWVKASNHNAYQQFQHLANANFSVNIFVKCCILNTFWLLGAGFLFPGQSKCLLFNSTKLPSYLHSCL